MKAFVFAVAMLAGAWGEAAVADDAPTPNAAVQQAIDAGNAAYVAAYRNSDPQAFAQIYDENGARFGDGGNGTVTRGRAAIEQEIAKVMNAVTGHVEVTIATQRLYVLDDRAYEEGRYTMSATLKKDGKARELSGQYVTIWKRQSDGGWKIYADMPVPGI